MMKRIPLETQTLYAEFLEQLVALHARRTIGLAPGCFTTKTVKGETYYYFQYSDPGGVSRQAYVGKRSPALAKVVASYEQDRTIQAADLERLGRLCAQLRVGHALTTDPASSRILRALAESGVFHLGGVLVGTHAFTVYGNLLGVRWESAYLKTQDIDIAGDARLDIAVPDLQVNVPAVLENLQMGFLPVPALNRKEPSTSFKIRGQSVRVDFLTPAHGARRGGTVFMNRLGVAAQPLKFLDYLLEVHIPAGIINGGGVLVNVPDPARYAFHKVLVSRSRRIGSQMKAEKDLNQALQLMDVLLDDRPGDLSLAWDGLRHRGQGWTKPVCAALATQWKRHPALINRLVDAVPTLKEDGLTSHR
ncbi:MAG: GSU2403 family nucleotidyltransferase fold protein [Nitrospira sp.]|nr:GSU2403 family nucleotidyltransferase fold protein [Nitrospira sp.]